MRIKEKLPENFELGFAIGVLSAIVTFISVAWLLWQIPIPTKLAEFPEHLQYWTALKVNELAPPLFQETADYYRNFLGRVDIGATPFLWRFNTSLILGVLAGCYLGYLVGKPESAIRHIKGRRLLIGERALQYLVKRSDQECKQGREGIAMYPSFKWRLSIDRETRHIMIIGSSGSGKTQITIPLIRAAIRRNDRMVVYDVKGDFTQWMPKHILLAPWDARSHAWDVAKDCRNANDARQLAARLIPPGHDPVWHNSARQILTAILIKLQTEMGTTWGWQDLFLATCLSTPDLLSIVQKYVPEAIHILSAPGKTTQSVLINFGSNMSLVSDLAKAWGNKPASQRFSFREWLSNGKTPNRIVVIQGSGDHEELAQAFTQGIIALITGFINSPGFPDSKHRRIWFFFDEFPQIGELKQAAPLLAVGRSKGIRVVLTAQDIHQIKAIYGDDIASTWISSVGTFIITQIKGGSTANFIAKELIGYQTIDRIVVHQGVRQSPIRENVLVMEPSELESELGRRGDKVAAIILGYDDACLLHWPMSKLTKSDLVRAASVQAEWLKPTYKGGTKATQPSTSNPPTNSSRAISRKPKLTLRPPSESELRAMAVTGTPEESAAEPLEQWTQSAMGGSHESH